MNQRKLLTFFVWLYCLSWAFDYRGEEGGSTIIQLGFFGITVMSASAVILLGFRHLFILPGGWLVLGWGLYIGSTFVVAVVNHVPMGDYSRTLLQVLLVWFSMCVTQVAAGAGLSYKSVLYPMLIAGVINVFWRAIYMLVIRGTPLDMVRVEMLSQCLPMLLAFMFCALTFRMRWPLMPLTIGMIGILSYVLSVTRSAIFIIFAEVMVCLWAAWRARQLGVLPKGFLNRKLHHGLTGFGALVAVLGLLIVAAPFVLERWEERLFRPVGADRSSADPSALTRMAEIKSFKALLDAEPATYIYGRGLGHAYYWDESYAVELAQYTYGNEDEFRSFAAHVTFPGHSIWTYALFSGGVIGLLSYVGLFGMGTYWAVKSVRKLPACPGFPLEIAFLPVVALGGFLSLSLTFNPFIERASSITMGTMLLFPQFLLMQAWRNARTPQPQAQTIVLPPGTQLVMSPPRS
jgi:hypothetical protein